MSSVGMLFLVLGLLATSPAADGRGPADRSRSEVDALIAEAGRAAPDWWNTTELDYPETLDLSWPVRQGFMQDGPGRFDERRGRGGRGRGRGRRGGFFEGRGRGFQQAQGSLTHVDDYLIQVVYPNPSRHRLGIKLVNHLMIKHKDDREKLQRSLNTLGNMFYDLLSDYARAAFWWQKCGQMGGVVDSLKMARCYYELGSSSTAKEMLLQVDGTAFRNRNDLIKLWAKIGDVDRALDMVNSSPSDNNWDRFGPRGRGGLSQSDKNLLAAEICRGAGRHDEAIAYYEKVLALPDWQTRPVNHHETDDKFQAHVNLAATRLLKTLDLKRVPAGTYAATVEAYGGPMTVNVVFKDEHIESVDIVRHWETYEYLIMAQPTARQIVLKQGFEGVDVITGATVTSDAIINAAVTALAQAMK